MKATTKKPGGKSTTTAAQADAAPAVPPEGNKKALVIDIAAGEDTDRAMVKARLHPVVSAAFTAQQFNKSLDECSVTLLVAELRRHVDDVSGGNMNRPEQILLMQAQTLDVIFNTLAQRAGANIGTHRDAAEIYLRMALKAQGQCRTTLETLAEIKAPRSTQFIKQQNVANQQQVNNGAAPLATAPLTHAHEKNSANQSNELLELQHGERMDGGTARTAIGIDPQLETVGAVNRPANGRRKNAQ